MIHDMSNAEFDEEFQKLTYNLNNLGHETANNLTFAELAEFVQVLSDASLHVSKFMSMSMRAESNVIPDFMTDMLPTLGISLLDFSDMTHLLTCVEEDDENNDDEENHGM